jgi:membrane associated rhomboid family serine protease
MFLPLGDDNSDRRITPYVNYILIAINILVFILLQKLGSNDSFTYAYCTVPAEILQGKDIILNGVQHVDQLTGQLFQTPTLYHTPIPIYFTLLSSAFLHGGFAHIAGNMFYLFIFGDNIENKLGHARYLFFYLFTAIIASFSHVIAVYFQGGNTLIPCVGASGAISAVLGAYMYLFPQNKVKVLILYFITSVPAVLALGVWIVFQIISGLGFLGGKGDGVAYAAHIGGFIAGFILISIMTPRQKKITV